MKLRTPDHFDQLNSLSLARNALTHNAGWVRSPEDCNSAGRDQLEVKWIALDLIAERDGAEEVLAELPFRVEAGDVVGIRFTERSLNVPAGTKIVLTHLHLAELCVFYSVIADEVVRGLLAMLRGRGHLRDEQVESPAGGR